MRSMTDEDQYKTDPASVGAAVSFLLERFSVIGEPDGEAWSDEMRGAAIRFRVDQTALENAFVAATDVRERTAQLVRFCAPFAIAPILILLFSSWDPFGIFAAVYAFTTSHIDQFLWALGLTFVPAYYYVTAIRRWEKWQSAVLDLNSLVFALAAIPVIITILTRVYKL